MPQLKKVKTMEEIQNTTNEPEVKEVQEEQPQEPALGEVLQHEPEVKAEPDKVGLDKFLEVKKQKKELQRELDALKSKIEDGDGSVINDIDDIADEYGVDKSFLKKFEKSIRANMEKEFESKVSEKFKPIEQAEKMNEANKKFEVMFNQTLERMPEYANVIDKDSVRVLAFQKENATLNLPQLIEKMYGKSISGKKTIETTTPRGGKDPQEIDFALAKKDNTYFNEIMADPDLKRKYNQNIENRLDL